MICVHQSNGPAGYRRWLDKCWRSGPIKVIPASFHTVQRDFRNSCISECVILLVKKLLNQFKKCGRVHSLPGMIFKNSLAIIACLNLGPLLRIPRPDGLSTTPSSSCLITSLPPQTSQQPFSGYLQYFLCFGFILCEASLCITFAGCQHLLGPSSWHTLQQKHRWILPDLRSSASRVTGSPVTQQWPQIVLHWEWTICRINAALW